MNKHTSLSATTRTSMFHNLTCVGGLTLKRTCPVVQCVTLRKPPTEFMMQQSKESFRSWRQRFQPEMFFNTSWQGPTRLDFEKSNTLLKSQSKFAKVHKVNRKMQLSRQSNTSCFLKGRTRKLYLQPTLLLWLSLGLSSLLVRVHYIQGNDSSEIVQMTDEANTTRPSSAVGPENQVAIKEKSRRYRHKQKINRKSNPIPIGFQLQSNSAEPCLVSFNNLETRPMMVVFCQ